MMTNRSGRSPTFPGEGALRRVGGSSDVPPRPRGSALAAGLACIGLLAGPALASASTRYASPSVADAPPAHPPLACTDTEPCSFKDAWEGAVDSDEIVVMPGDYDVSSSSAGIDKKLTIHGVDGQPARYLHSDTLQGLRLQAEVTLRHLSIEMTGAGPGLFIGDTGDGSSVEQVIVRSAGTQGCLAQDASGVDFTDSVCISTATNSAALAAFFTDGSAGSATLRNVTARSTGAGGYGVVSAAQNAGSIATVTAHNVIADGGGADARATANTGGQSSLTLDRSNYGTELEQGGLVTDPGSGDNQLAAPLLAADGFHQVSGSPTIDAGSAAAPLGAADVDGEARTVGTAIDIGADEFQPPPVVTPPVTPPPAQNPPATLPGTRFCHGTKATILAGAGLTKGTPRRDVIVGTSGADMINALGGNDLVCAGGGSDKVFGGAGKDRLLGQAGRDKLYGQTGRDQLLGGSGRDLLVGGGGHDALLGGPAKDITRQ